MQKSLSLSGVTGKIPHSAFVPDLRNMTNHHFPAFDLSCIFLRNSATHVIAAVPLKQAAGIVLINPVILLPNP